MARHTHLHLMLIEDNVGDVAFLKERLKDDTMPSTVHHEFTGEEALNCLKEEHLDLDLILVDVNMPGMDGHDTVEAIRVLDDYHETPIAMLTSSRAPKDLERARRSGANGYLAKGESFGVYGLLSFVDLVRSGKDLFLQVK